MRIDQLPFASSVTNGNTLPVNVSGTTEQVTIGNLVNSIRDDVYGAPLTAATAAAMTDQTKIYVYTGTTGGGFTNGHWYYYNGTAWTDGGVYNSAAVQTDTTLSLSGVPADAKAVGDAISATNANVSANATAIEENAENIATNTTNISNLTTRVSADEAAIAPTFIASKEYAAGAYVWNNGKLYRFTAAHAAGAWTGTDAAQVALAGDVADLKSALTSIEDFSWSPGFINVNGNVDSPSDANRQHSDYLICPPEMSVKYVAETNHAAVLGISFYDENKTFISGVANNGSMGTVQTVTSPKRTRYCRLSTRLEILHNTYYLPNTSTLQYTLDVALTNKDELGKKTNGFIKFGTDGSIRGQAVSIEGLLYASVVDDDYQITLYYLNASGTEVNGAWGSYYRLADYKQPTRLVIRKTDNGAMPVASANQAVVGTYLSGYATNEYVYQTAEIAYVDGTDGADTNNGINPTTAFKTIQKAIDLGYKKILVREGTYTGGINLNRMNGVEIKINKSYSAYDASTANTNPKIIIDCNDTLNNGVRCVNCSNCTFEGIEVKNAVQSGWYIEKCEGFYFSACVAHDCPTGMGFELWNTNADFVNCGCYNIGTYGGSKHRDGFNLHGTGTQNFKNCWANYCEDDGISHHDACEGYVDGGEWHHCGKGGVCTPTHGAKIDVSNVYVHNCGYGVYAGNDTAALAKTFNISGCACKDNTNYDIYVTNNTANIWNCIYDTIGHFGVGENNILTTN